MIEKRNYEVTNLIVTAAKAESLTEPSLEGEILERMSKVIETEAPITEELLFKRVILSFSLLKVGSRIFEAFKRASLNLPFERRSEGGITVFHKDSDENFFRPTPDSNVRYSYQIPVSEASKCIEYILEKEGKPVMKRNLAILFRNELEYDRMGAALRKLFEESLKTARVERRGAYYRQV